TRIKKDHFVLDLAKAIVDLPIIEGYELELAESKILNVTVPKGRSLNLLFQQLTAQDIDVLSLKNKTNRLEQLFMDLVNE
ncbi:MAG: ABC transporter ATP-binding protein, partial [Methylomarinum sp.]|nr:ABC transporter ATP-binding protein [Methylomarinum sp.]